jgi:hypothetical protein
LSKEQVVEVVELVEKELLSQSAARPTQRDPLISDLHAIRVKDDGQLIQELDTLGKEVLKTYPQIGSTIEVDEFTYGRRKSSKFASLQFLSYLQLLFIGKIPIG